MTPQVEAEAKTFRGLELAPQLVAQATAPTAMKALGKKGSTHTQQPQKIPPRQTSSESFEGI